MNKYQIKTTPEGFWNTMSDASLDFISANAGWMHGQPINELNLVEGAFEELLFLKEIDYPLNTSNNLETPGYIWLAHPDHYDEYLQLKQHSINHANSIFIKEFCQAMVEIQADENTITQNIQTYLEDITPPPPVNNGVNINWTQVGPTWNPADYFPKIGQTNYRHPYNPPNEIPEDMQHGTDGNGIGILLNIEEELMSDVGLISKMTNLFNLSTIANPSMTDVAHDFIARFQNNSGGDYYHTTLSNVLRNSGSMHNALKMVGISISDEIKRRDGETSNFHFPQELPDNRRPVFSGDFFGGGTILVNDTEVNEVYLEDMSVNTTNKTWTATIYFDIKDHFGLDAEDLTGEWYKRVWRQKVPGFTAWYRLQHKRNYAPFRSVLRIKANINGTY